MIKRWKDGPGCHNDMRLFLLWVSVRIVEWSVPILGQIIPSHQSLPGVEAPPSGRRSQVGTVSVCSSVMLDPVMKRRLQSLNGHWPDSSSSWLQTRQRETNWEQTAWEQFKMYINSLNPLWVMVNNKSLKGDFCSLFCLSTLAYNSEIGERKGQKQWKQKVYLKKTLMVKKWRWDRQHDFSWGNN